MRNRCGDPNRPVYKDMEVCERWQSFENFLADMGERPDGCTIDRIDPDKGYYPDNCRWATTEEQALNRKNVVLVRVGDEEDTLRAFADKYGIPRTTIYRRYKQGVRGYALIDRTRKGSNKWEQKYARAD